MTLYHYQGVVLTCLFSWQHSRLLHGTIQEKLCLASVRQALNNRDGQVVSSVASLPSDMGSSPETAS